MTSERVERRLAAILAADVAGYSRLMGARRGGHARRAEGSSPRAASIPRSPSTADASSRPPATACWLEFASVVDAVRCAVEVQRGMAERNAEVLPETAHRVPHRHQRRRHHRRRRRHLRRRRQRRGAAGRRSPSPAASASPTTRAGRSRDKLDIAFEDVGEQQLKNIARPVRVCRVRLGADARRRRRSRVLRAARQALDRRAAVPEHERRSRAGVFRRRHGRGHHHGAVAHALAVRDRAQFELHLQGPGRRREAGRPRARRALRARRQRAQGGEPGAHHRPAHRRRNRRASLGGPLRRRARGHLRSAGPE